MVTNTPTVTHDRAVLALSDALNAYVGLGRRISVSALSGASGVPESTIRSYMLGEKSPGLSHFLSLIAALPPEATNNVMQLAGLQAVPADRDKAANTMVLNSNGAAVLHKIADALSNDGRIDHLETRELIPLVESLHATAAGWLQRHK